MWLHDSGHCGIVCSGHATTVPYRKCAVTTTPLSCSSFKAFDNCHQRISPLQPRLPYRNWKEKKKKKKDKILIFYRLGEKSWWIFGGGYVACKVPVCGAPCHHFHTPSVFSFPGEDTTNKQGGCLVTNSTLTPTLFPDKVRNGKRRTRLYSPTPPSLAHHLFTGSSITKTFSEC